MSFPSGLGSSGYEPTVLYLAANGDHARCAFSTATTSLHNVPDGMQMQFPLAVLFSLDPVAGFLSSLSCLSFAFHLLTAICLFGTGAALAHCGNRCLRLPRIPRGSTNDFFFLWRASHDVFSSFSDFNADFFIFNYDGFLPPAFPAMT